MIEASLIIPTRKRSQLLEQRLCTLKNNTPEIMKGEVEVILCVDSDDYDSKQLAVKTPFVYFIVECQPLEIPAVKWNMACKHAKGKWLVTISDDCIPQPNWLTNALNMLSRGFIGLPDGVTGNRNNYFTPLYMATREWLRKYNGGVLVIPKYKSWYADIETAIRAQRSNTYTVGRNSVVTQLHSIFQTAPDDEIYRIGEMRRAEDLAMYNMRASYGFPDDFEGVL